MENGLLKMDSSKGMGNLVDAINQNGQLMQMVASQLQVTNNQIAVISSEQKDMKADIIELKETSEITNLQANSISTAVTTLARELVGYPSYIYGVTIQDIYRYLRNYWNLGRPLATTEKRHYESVITGLNNYKDNHFDKEALIEHKQNLDKAKIII